MMGLTRSEVNMDKEEMKMTETTWGKMNKDPAKFGCGGDERKGNNLGCGEEGTAEDRMRERLREQ